MSNVNSALPRTDCLTANCRIKPINYSLSLFDLEFGGKWGYSGLVKIDSKVAESTAEIVINTKELEIQGAEVFGGDGKCMCSLELELEPRLCSGPCSCLIDISSKTQLPERRLVRHQR